MDISSLNIDESVKSLIINQDGISSLYPSQAIAIDKGLLEKKNLLIAIPTASGKTLLAELAALKTILEFGGKVIYLCPLRALATEKFNDFKRFESLGVKVTITSSDYDSQDRWLPQYDIIISTNEKMDALLRHGVKWITEDVTLLIVDECHLIDDKTRGPTLETFIAQMMMLNKNFQLIGLSATIGNPLDLAQWLQAELVESDWRPVELKKGIYFDSEIIYSDYKTRKLDQHRANPLENIVFNSIIADEQVLIFCNSRRNAVSTAKKLEKLLEPKLSKENKIMLKKIAEEIIERSTDPLSTSLAQVIQGGVAFHHAGLSSSQRKIVESSFKKHNLKIIAATPTLAAGINIPAKRVIIQSVYRWTDRGNQPIKVLEYEQMAGRAGRPQFDTEGESLIIARKNRDIDSLMDRFLLNDVEVIESKLAAEPALRKVILGLIASKSANTFPELMAFFDHTFYGYQYEAYLLEERIRYMLEFLKKADMITEEDGENLNSTRYGKRVSDLYLDPLSAFVMSEGMKNWIDSSSNELPVFVLLDLICGTPDMTPLYVRGSEEKKIDQYIDEYKDRFLRELPDIAEIEFEARMREIKTTLILFTWINEVDLSDIVELYNIGSGDIRRLTDLAEWLLTGLNEVVSVQLGSFPHPMAKKRMKIFKKKTKELGDRILHGIKSDSIPLVRIKGIGRKRARILIDHGIKTVATLRNITIDELADLPNFGSVMAKSIKKELKSINDEKKISDDFVERDEIIFEVTTKPSPKKEKRIKKGKSLDKFMKN